MSVREEAEAFLGRYSFSGLLENCNIRLSLAPGQVSRGKQVYCLVTMSVPDTKGAGTFEAITAFSIRLDRPEEENHVRVLNAVAERLLHETAEGVAFDGEAPYDPHSDSSIRRWRGWYSLQKTET